MARYWGINAFGHDASLCVVQNNEILYHKLSGSEFLNQQLIDEAKTFGEPDLICYYEKPLLKRMRNLYSKEWNKTFNLLTPKLHLMEFEIYKPIKYISHHESHAAAAYFTSEHKDAIILVADAIGEWDTLSVWRGIGDSLLKLKSVKYPFSLGLFYTAFSRLYGVSENELMNLSINGNPDIHYDKVYSYLHKNLHRGIHDWNGDIDNNLPSSVQKVFVDYLKFIVDPYKKISNTLIFTGGCAYNKLAVSQLGAVTTINPGDSSSSIGAVAAHLKTNLKLRL